MRRLAITWICAWSLAACGHAGSTVRGTTASGGARRGEVDWQPWSAASFARAARERKLLFVSVQAGWCHWCHVMNETTLRDPEVLALLAESFVVVRVDADARPELAERYARWGWPANALLTPDAEPIVNLRGYREARAFARTLRGLAEAQRAGRTLAVPEETHEPDPALADLVTLRARVATQLDALYDERLAGWGATIKYPVGAPVVELLFRAGSTGDTGQRARALASLDAYRALEDPVWSGIFQYSVNSTWGEPHYEKIVSVQAGMLEAYAAAMRATGDPSWGAHGERLARYVLEHLRAPSGAFWASQDADVGTGGAGPHMLGAAFYALDDAGRRRVGEPRIDRHEYASHNGLLIAGLARLGMARGDSDVLRAAAAAAERMLAARDARGFPHDAAEPDAMRTLADQVDMAWALVSLHEATGQRRWLDEAITTMRAAERELGDGDAGGFFATSIDPNAAGVFRARRKPLRDNGVAARVLLRIGRIEHDDAWTTLAERTLRTVASPRLIESQNRLVGEYLLALDEATMPWSLVTVVGPPNDARTDALFRAAVAVPSPARLVTRDAPGQGQYPYPGTPSAFVCSASSCSEPLEDPAAIAAAVDRALRD